jgi:hypothetical protein
MAPAANASAENAALALALAIAHLGRDYFVIPPPARIIEDATALDKTTGALFRGGRWSA